MWNLDKRAGRSSVFRYMAIQNTKCDEGKVQVLVSKWKEPKMFGFCQGGVPGFCIGLHVGREVSLMYTVAHKV